MYELIKIAFETAEHSDGDEQVFAENLRNGENYISALDLVAEVDGELVGHIMFTKTYVAQPDDCQYNTLMVAPLSVLLKYRSMGIGSGLMKEGFRLAEAMGYGAAFLLGDPDYYQRFGYKLTSLYSIRHDIFPSEFLMAKEIVPNALEGIVGILKM